MQVAQELDATRMHVGMVQPHPCPAPGLGSGRLDEVQEETCRLHSEFIRNDYEFAPGALFDAHHRCSSLAHGRDSTIACHVGP